VRHLACAIWPYRISSHQPSTSGRGHSKNSAVQQHTAEPPTQKYSQMLLEGATAAYDRHVK
jgi:signal recognition particle subunit SEC65